MDLRQNLLRILALGALIAAVVVVVVVVSSSLPDSDDQAGQNLGKQEKEENGSGDKFYVVQEGDSLSTIAEKEGVDLETLEQLNPELDPQTLTTGQRVKLR
jgi:LysM repeat protein